VFDPAGRTLASIAQDRAPRAGLAFPVGPLRLVDPASGAVRTLLDGSVIGFFWAPDGRTIAALQLKGGNGSTVADARLAAAVASAPPEASTGPTPPPDTALHLVFVDVASGTARSDRIIRPSARFVNEFLPYFDQYALSHRVWAPDGSSLALPVVGDDGTSRLAVFRPDATEPALTIDGQAGFWSP
jgi:TolB protein